MDEVDEYNINIYKFTDGDSDEDEDTRRENSDLQVNKRKEKQRKQLRNLYRTSFIGYMNKGFFLFFLKVVKIWSPNFSMLKIARSFQKHCSTFPEGFDFSKISPKIEIFYNR